MYTRHVGIVGAVVLLGLGLVLTVAELGAEPAQEPVMTVAVAARTISPYTVITQDMIQLGADLPVREARDGGAYPMHAVIGLMSVDVIGPGTMITGVNAKPIEDVRFAQDMGLEIVSFQATVDRVVGGEVRPGHLINLYGTGREEEDPLTILIERRLWVVNVSSGGRPVTQATPQPDALTGELEYVGGERDIPSTLITVAVPPKKAVHIIHDVGSRHLDPYVTLAANSTWEMPPTPEPGLQAAQPIVTIPDVYEFLKSPTPYPEGDDGLGQPAQP